MNAFICTVISYSGVSSRLSPNQFFLKPGLETFKINEIRERRVMQTFLSSRDVPEKVKEQGTDKRTQEDYPTSAVNFMQM